MRIRLNRRIEQTVEYAILGLLLVCLGVRHANLTTSLVAVLLYIIAMSVLRKLAV